MAPWEQSGSPEAIVSYTGLQRQGRTHPSRVRGSLPLHFESTQLQKTGLISLFCEGPQRMLSSQTRAPEEDT